MEKDPNFMRSGGGGGGGMSSSTAMPSAPPSYDEAVINAGASGAHLYPSANIAPYPMSSSPMSMPGNHDQPQPGIPMPMPDAAAAAAAAAKSLVQTYPANNTQYSQQFQNAAPQTYAPPPAQIHIIQQTNAYAVGPNPLRMKCPSCRADIQTSTTSEHQGIAHICCLVLCLLGCCLCSCIPYCMNSFKTVRHNCPNCKAFIGTWKG